MMVIERALPKIAAITRLLCDESTTSGRLWVAYQSMTRHMVPERAATVIALVDYSERVQQTKLESHNKKSHP
ncbi:hypothetical protein [Bradyrhizobium sp. NFR13]|jgi:hypothetical protein|uniref:hypothetical protein n=1 Tax=Bradyrhizobium sp. NFR13 TaxID=1566285 RepID=UPI0011143553|nr:hypothetical protein [Bradyrhizobium sp. NFR13]